jgi:DNA-binding NarL/FixJ family response regulator
MRKLSVLLVDDNLQFLKAARDLVAGLPCVAGVGCAGSGAEALAQASQSRPDLVLTDIVMPGMSGFEVIRTLHARENPPRIVALTLHESADYRAAVQRSGADGLVPKREFGALVPQLIASLAGTSDA